MSWIATSVAASAALSATSAHSGGKAANAQAAAQSKLEDVKIREAQNAMGQLGATKDAKVEVAQVKFGHNAEGLGIQKEEAGNQLNTAIEKSGLKTSAGVTQKKSSMWKKFEHAETGLLGQLGKDMGGIEEWYEGEKSRIGGVIKRASLQKKALDKQSDSWYLGKMITGG
jgi:hypothetical protein